MDILSLVWLGTPAWAWLAFMAIVVALLVLDLAVLYRRPHAIGVRESLVLAAVYVLLGLGFGGWVWWYAGETAGINYLTGFVIEKSLAIDNVFVIAMIFTHLGVPRRYQHRVLFFGILGAILLRALMIALGATLVHRFAWLLYLFAGFLVVTGIKMWRAAERDYDVVASPVLKLMRRHVPICDQLDGQSFFVRMRDPDGDRVATCATPLFVALVLIEVADVIFAIDSVPAILAITTDPFIVYTSNIFAILGLRALYFTLAAMMHRFRYLKYALSVLLVFIGAKLLVIDGLGLEKIPPIVSLGLTFAILGTGILYSLWKTRQPAGGGEDGGRGKD